MAVSKHLTEQGIEYSNKPLIRYDARCTVGSRNAFYYAEVRPGKDSNNAPVLVVVARFGRIGSAGQVHELVYFGAGNDELSAATNVANEAVEKKLQRDYHYNCTDTFYTEVTHKDIVWPEGTVLPWAPAPVAAVELPTLLVTGQNSRYSSKVWTSRLIAA